MNLAAPEPGRHISESRPASVRIMDADAFSMLTGGGVKFDRQRFAKDFTSLAQPKPRPVVESLAAGPGPSSAAAQTTGHQSTAKREPPTACINAWVQHGGGW